MAQADEPLRRFQWLMRVVASTLDRVVLERREPPADESRKVAFELCRDLLTEMRELVQAGVHKYLDPETVSQAKAFVVDILAAADKGVCCARRLSDSTNDQADLSREISTVESVAEQLASAEVRLRNMPAWSPTNDVATRRPEAPNQAVDPKACHADARLRLAAIRRRLDERSSAQAAFGVLRNDHKPDRPIFCTTVSSKDGADLGAISLKEYSTLAKHAEGALITLGAPITEHGGLIGWAMDTAGCETSTWSCEGAQYVTSKPADHPYRTVALAIDLFLAGCTEAKPPSSESTKQRDKSKPRKKPGPRREQSLLREQFTLGVLIVHHFGPIPTAEPASLKQIAGWLKCKEGNASKIISRIWPDGMQGYKRLCAGEVNDLRGFLTKHGGGAIVDTAYLEKAPLED